MRLTSRTFETSAGAGVESRTKVLVRSFVAVVAFVRTHNTQLSTFLLQLYNMRLFSLVSALSLVSGATFSCENKPREVLYQADTLIKASIFGADGGNANTDVPTKGGLWWVLAIPICTSTLNIVHEIAPPVCGEHCYE
jgi:hypothetical protein